MARVLAYTSPAKGHVFPMTAILLELKARGHDVVLRTLASEVPTVRAAGVEAEAVDARVEQIADDDWQGGSPRKALQRTMHIFGSRAALDGADLRGAIEAERPDAVLVDTNCWGALSAAEAWGGPWASVFPYPMPIDSRDAPPFGPGLAPARGPAGRLRDRALRPLVIGTLEKLMRPPVNEVRAAHDLRPVATVNDLFGAPPLTLYLTAEPFEYARSDWPGNVLQVGPCEWEGSATSPGWVADLERPVVLVTTSSLFQDDTRLVHAALEALADEPVQVVATLPADVLGTTAVPANARVERFVPHGPLLDRAVCAVTHGGMGATQKALARGVPVCAVPFGRDQLEVARRVEVAGAGTRLPASRLRPDRLRDAVRQAMGCTDGAARVAAGYAAAGGAPAAALAVESRLLG